MALGYVCWRGARKKARGPETRALGQLQEALITPPRRGPLFQETSDPDEPCHYFLICPRQP